jgi:hypothetical protein
MDEWIQKFTALSIGEKIIIPAGGFLFIDGFLPWYRVSEEVLGFSVNVSRNGWQSPGQFWSILAVFIGLAMAATVILKNFSQVEIPDNVGGLSWPKLYLGGGAAALAFLLIKVLNESSYMSFGFYLGFLAAAALAAAGYLMYKEESEAI